MQKNISNIYSSKVYLSNKTLRLITRFFTCEMNHEKYHIQINSLFYLNDQSRIIHHSTYLQLNFPTLYFTYHGLNLG